MNVNNDRLQVYLLLYFRLPVVADDRQQPSSAIRSTPICHNARVYFFCERRHGQETLLAQTDSGGSTKNSFSFTN